MSLKQTFQCVCLESQFVFFYPFFLPQVTYIFYFCLILLQIAILDELSLYILTNLNFFWNPIYFWKNTKKRFLYCNFLQLQYAKYNGMKITIATKIKAKIDSRSTFCGLVQRSLLAVVSKYTAKSTIMTNSPRQNIIWVIW